MAREDPDPRTENSEGWALLDRVWFKTIKELELIVEVGERTEDRVAAAEVLLNYFKSFGQSISQVWVPTVVPAEEEDDE